MFSLWLGKTGDPQRYDSVHRLRDTVRDTVRYFQNLPDNGEAANSMMPVVENAENSHAH